MPLCRDHDEATHSDYPHWPGYLIGCHACDGSCHCGPEVEAGEVTQCVWEGHDQDQDPDAPPPCSQCGTTMQWRGTTYPSGADVSHLWCPTCGHTGPDVVDYVL